MWYSSHDTFVFFCFSAAVSGVVCQWMEDNQCEGNVYRERWRSACQVQHLDCWWQMHYMCSQKWCLGETFFFVCIHISLLAINTVFLLLESTAECVIKWASLFWIWIHLVISLWLVWLKSNTKFTLSSLSLLLVYHFIEGDRKRRMFILQIVQSVCVLVVKQSRPPPHTLSFEKSVSSSNQSVRVLYFLICSSFRKEADPCSHA